MNPRTGQVNMALWHQARAQHNRRTPTSRPTTARVVGDYLHVNAHHSSLHGRSDIADTVACKCGYLLCAQTGPCAPPAGNDPHAHAVWATEMLLHGHTLRVVSCNWPACKCAGDTIRCESGSLAIRHKGGRESSVSTETPMQFMLRTTASGSHRWEVVDDTDDSARKSGGFAWALLQLAKGKTLRAMDRKLRKGATIHGRTYLEYQWLQPEDSGWHTSTCELSWDSMVGRGWRTIMFELAE